MFVVIARCSNGLHLSAIFASNHLDKAVAVARSFDKYADFVCGDSLRIHRLNLDEEPTFPDYRMVFQRLRRANDWLEIWTDETLRQSVPPAGKISLAEAQKTHTCRICGCPVYVTALNPTGWEHGFREQVAPDHVILSFGKEFAHQHCLEEAKLAAT